MAVGALPLAGVRVQPVLPCKPLLVIHELGGFAQNPWAWDAYFAFWLMAGISLVADVIRYGRNRHAEDPRHGLLGGVRATIVTPLTVFILWTMAMRESVLAVHLFG